MHLSGKFSFLGWGYLSNQIYLLFIIIIIFFFLLIGQFWLAILFDKGEFGIPDLEFGLIFEPWRLIFEIFSFLYFLLCAFFDCWWYDLCLCPIFVGLHFCMLPVGLCFWGHACVCMYRLCIYVYYLYFLFYKVEFWIPNLLTIPGLRTRLVFLLYIFCFTRWNLNSRPFYFTWYFVPRQVFCLAGIKEFFFFVCFDLVRRYVDFIRRNLEFSTLHGGYFLFFHLEYCVYGYVGASCFLSLRIPVCFFLALLDRGTLKSDWTKGGRQLATLDCTTRSVHTYQQSRKYICLPCTRT